MASKKESTALATTGAFQIANRYEGMDPELLAELKDELDDLDPASGITCRTIKIPAGGGIAYEIQGEDEGDSDVKKEIDGVIIFTHRCNGYWPGAYGGDDQNKIPICSSMDGKTGLNGATGEITPCETCVYNQFGSGTDQNGQPSRGKACKNMRRLYLMMDGDPNFYLLTVPPTSIKDVNAQLAKIIAGGVPYTGLVVRLSLQKAQNAGGIAYSKVVIKKAGPLPQEVAAQAVAMRRQIKEQYQNMALTLDEYQPAPERGKPVNVSADDWTDEAAAVEPADFQEAPPHGDNDLPF